MVSGEILADAIDQIATNARKRCANIAKTTPIVQIHKRLQANSLPQTICTVRGRRKVRMKSLLFVGLTVLCVSSSVAYDNLEAKKIVCFWNSTSFLRTGTGQFEVENINPALKLCTHLIYGYAGISSENYEVIQLYPNIDTDLSNNFYWMITRLKNIVPNLKVYLSIGGNADPFEITYKYLKVTETPETRSKFINSIINLLNYYKFDGIDLAWQFPSINEQFVVGHYWPKKGKLRALYKLFQDDNETAHRKGFVELVRDLKNQLQAKDKSLTLTVLPHVNATAYYDARALGPIIDAVHLMAFDQKTPERSPEEADYPAPITSGKDRSSEGNVESFVRYWQERGTPGNKIIVGIPTFARTWKLTSLSRIFEVPTGLTRGPGERGPLTQMPGILSYPEVCLRLTESEAKVVRDKTKNYGIYAYIPYHRKTGTSGIWIGYENPETARNKASYVKSKGLGGIAIFDLSTDDFRGSCSGNKFPILKAIRRHLPSYEKYSEPIIYN